MVARAPTGDDSMKSRITFSMLATALAVVMGCSDSTGPVEIGGSAVSVSPDVYTLFGDEPARLIAEVTDAAGDPVTGARLAWESNDTNIVRIDSSGVVRGVSPGATFVTATLSNGAFGTARIAVTGFTSVAAGYTHTCATTLENETYCWGDNTGGQLGDGSLSPSLTPALVAGTEDFATVYAGHNQTCALTWQGAAFCWGPDVRRLGVTTTASHPTPKPVAGGHSFAQFSLGEGSSCAVTTGSVAYCWSVFPSVPGGITFRQVIRGNGRSCGVTAAKAIHCWGTDVLGDTTVSSALLSDAHMFASVAVGGSITCALTEQGAAYCWRYGQAGPGPVAVAGALTFQSLDAELGTVCGVTTSGDAYCWGNNNAGQLGNGTTTASLHPSRVAGGLTFKSVSVGRSHACGVRRSGAIYCWGANDHGQLGDGTTNSSLIPVRVPRPS